MPRRSTRALWTERVRKGETATISATSHETRRGKQFQGYVLGIDPSLRGSGFALVQVTCGGKLALIHSETLKIGSAVSFYDCLGRIAQKTERLVNQYPVDHVAVEQTIYVQNFQTAQILGAARGAVIAPASIAGKPVFEYPPLRVKQAIVGFGRASKEQMGAMLTQLLSLPQILALDESDAAGVAVCHAFTHRD